MAKPVDPKRGPIDLPPGAIAGPDEGNGEAVLFQEGDGFESLPFISSNFGDQAHALDATDVEGTTFLQLGEENTGEMWKRFRAVPPALRSWLSRSMLYVDGVLDFLRTIDKSGLTPPVQDVLRKLGPILEEIVHDLQSPLLENGGLSLLGLERIQNLLFRVGEGFILRFNINMTAANKIDSSGRLGTAFKNVVFEWLRDEFGKRHVSFTPGGTSFIVINAQPHEVSCSAGRFAREIRFRLEDPKIIARYGYDPAIIERFVPQATTIVGTIDAHGADVSGIVRRGNREEILDLQNRMMDIIIAALRALAVGGALVERDPGGIGLMGGRAVYALEELPILPGTFGHDAFVEALNHGIDYIPASVYWPPYLRFPEGVSDAQFVRHPRFAHNYGRVDHPPRPNDPGGALQVLQRALIAAAEARTDPERELAAAALSHAVGNFSMVLSLGAIARRNPRNPAFVKFMQEITLHDGTNLMDSYFIEDLAMYPGTSAHLLGIELNSFKAFLRAYPTDEADSNFWGVFDVLRQVAQEMDIELPLASWDSLTPVHTQVGGDYVVVAIPTVTRDGFSVGIEEFARRFQQLVVELYEDRPHQDYMKVAVHNGNGEQWERWPLWQRGDEIFPEKQAPTDPQVRKFVRTLSVTTLATTVDVPREPSAKKRIYASIGQMDVAIERLNDATAPYKGGFAYMSEQQLLAAEETPQQMPSPGGTLPMESFGGIVLVPEGPSGSPGYEKFTQTASAHLSGAWQDSWNSLPPERQQQFVDALYARSGDIPPVLTPDVSAEVFAGIGVAGDQFFIPPVPVLLPFVAVP